MRPGDELPELRVTPDRYATVRYAGASGDFNPIHLDDELARGVGLPGRVLHGLWSMAQVARVATEAGGGPASLRRLRVQFRAFAFPEQEIVVRGTVAAVCDGVVRVELTAEQDGRPVVRDGEAELGPG